MSVMSKNGLVFNGKNLFKRSEYINLHYLQQLCTTSISILESHAHHKPELHHQV
jgi:hypothetical protein